MRKREKHKNKPHDVFKQVDMKGGDTTQCWPWLGFKRTDPRGNERGIFSVEGKKLYAHRVVWECYNGRPLEHKEVIRHTCDNTICCNPHHLLVGVQKDNVRDMLERERVGEKKEVIIKVMHLLETGISAAEVSRFMRAKFDIDIEESVVRKIRGRRLYRHIDWPWGDAREAERLAKLKEHEDEAG